MKYLIFDRTQLDKYKHKRFGQANVKKEEKLWKGVDWTNLARDKEEWQDLASMTIQVLVPKIREFIH